MTRNYTLTPCEGPDSKTIKEFNLELVEVHMALVDQLANYPDMPDAEADQLMTKIGMVELFMRCSRYLH